MALIQVTAYLRNEEDLNIWKDLENKTEFLHKALNTKSISEEDLTSLGKNLDETRTGQPTAKIINSPEDVNKIFPEAKVISKPPVTVTRPIQAA